jgi:hypothetical protein
MLFRHITTIRHYSTKASSVRGTHDILPHKHNIYNFIIQTASRIAERYGFKQMSTPILEHVGIFIRTLGEDSDVVSKEMYTFTDKNKTHLCLRPENTAGISADYDLFIYRNCKSIFDKPNASTFKMLLPWSHVSKRKPTNGSIQTGFYDYETNIVVSSIWS